MIVEIKSAKPVISKNPNLKFSYYVKNWDVTGYTWDGDCMCTKKDFDLEIEWPKLCISENELKGLVRDYLHHQ